MSLEMSLYKGGKHSPYNNTFVVVLLKCEVGEEDTRGQTKLNVICTHAINRVNIQQLQW